MAGSQRGWHGATAHDGGMGMIGGMNGYGMMGRPMYQPMSSMPVPWSSNTNTHQQQEPEVKGKGKVVELDGPPVGGAVCADRAAGQEAARDDEERAMEPELDRLDESSALRDGHGRPREVDWRGIQAEREAMRDLDAEEDFAKFDSTLRQ